MFHKYNPFTNTLTPSDQVSAYVAQSLSNKETTNNYFVAPQPKARKAAEHGARTTGTLASSQNPVLNLIGAKAESAASTIAAKAQTVAANVTQAAAAGGHGSSSAAHGHGHGHGSHAAPWEGVNLWRTPYKGDTDTITQVKRSKGTLDQYVENRTRRIQQLQLYALRNKSIPTWVMMPRDKLILGVQSVIAAYVLFQVTTTVYNHLKAKDRLKLLKLLYKDNVD